MVPSSGPVAMPSWVAQAYCLSSTLRTSEATALMSRVRGLATTPPVSFRKAATGSPSMPVGWTPGLSVACLRPSVRAALSLAHCPMAISSGPAASRLARAAL